MTGPAFDRILDALRAAGRPVTMEGPNRARSSCPAHDGDNKTALSILDTADRVNLHCFTRDCDGADVLAALGMGVRDLYHEPRGDRLAAYDYGGNYWVERMTGKTFRQATGWAGRPRPLYRAERIPDAVAAGQPVYLVEGEEDVHALEAVAPDAVAVTAPQGAGNFRHADVEPLRGASVVAVVDRDAAGDGWAASVRERLDGVAAALTFRQARTGKDLGDHVTAGHALSDLDPYRAAGDALEAPTASGNTWTRVDLGATVAGLVAGTLRRAAPTVAAVRGGTALFYPGKVNGLAGESGAGKTWTLLHAAAGILDDGGTVVYIDHEDDPAGIVGRLLDLGVSADAVGARFAYLNPSEKPTAGDLQALAALVADLRPVLVVVDSTGEGLALEGANPNADEEVAAWFLRVPRRLSLVAYDDQPGPAVVVLDHVTKADDGGLWPIGSQRKRAAISGAQYMQRLVKPFDKDTAGHALLVCAKDRHGNYRTGQRVAELHVTPGPVITLDAVEDAARPNGFRPTGYMERVSRALESSPAPLSLNGVRDAVGGKREHVTRALSALVADGYVTTAAGPRGATLHTLVRPFREGDDRSPEDMPESEPGTTVDRAPFLREGNGAQSLDRAPGNGGGTVGHGHHEAPELCPLHGENAHPDACYTCAELAGRGWDE